MKRTISLVFLLLLLAGCMNKIETNMDSKVADFSFINQYEEDVSLDDVAGDYWIAYFFYTDCKMVCPRTTANMADVQQALLDDKVTPNIVGFTVDPEFDTTDVLIDYAEEYGIDNDSFTMLTGYEFDEVQSLSKDSFKSVLEDGGPKDNAFAHSTYFFLVDDKGKVVKRYDGLSMKEIDLLIEDAKKVM